MGKEMEPYIPPTIDIGDENKTYIMQADSTLSAMPSFWPQSLGPLWHSVCSPHHFARDMHADDLIKFPPILLGLRIKLTGDSNIKVGGCG